MFLKNFLDKSIISVISNIIFINILFLTYSVDVSSFKINYFKENSQLYYVNAINNDDGDLYIEYWGEKENKRYIIGLNLTSGENIYFDENNKIKEIYTGTPSVYHESIIINYNNEYNIFSINYINFDFINIQKEEFTNKATNDIFFEEQGKPGYRNSLIKLKNNNYLLSIILLKYSYLNYHHKLLLTLFDFNSNNIEGYNPIANYDDTIDYINSTSCFQTESEYIQCSYNKLFAFSNYLTIAIFDKDLNYKGNQDIASINDNVFTKIFHIKNELGAYIYFDKNDNLPQIQIKILNDNKKELNDKFDFEYIILNGNGKYELNDGLFFSDGIKINDSKFVVILTSKDLLNLLICIFDLYNNDNSFRLRYYYLELNSKNIMISVNIRAFKFGNFLGISFYDSNSESPGYFLINFPNLNNENNYLNNTYSEIKLFTNSSNYILSFPEIILENNIFGGEIIKIKIVNFEDAYNSGVIITSSNLDKEISINDELELNDQLLFEPNYIGAIPGEYILYYSPIIKESESNDINYNPDLIEYYGETTINYESKTFEGNIFRIIYSIECYEKCKTCNQLGSESFYYCVQCKDEYPTNYNNGEKCICEDYIYFDDNGEKSCIPNCEEEKYKYEKNEYEKYCLTSCLLNKEELYIDENDKYCYNSCLDINNKEVYTYEKNCVSVCPEPYYPNENGICSLQEEEIPTTNLKNTILDVDITSTNINAQTSLIHITNEVDIISSTISEAKEESKENEKLENILEEPFTFIRSVINNYILKNSELEIEEFDNNTIISCYSSKTDIDTLINIDSRLTYVDLNECADLLITENNLDSNSELIIIGTNNLNISTINNFDYSIYTTEGEKISNLTICENATIEISYPLNNLDEINYDAAVYLSNQGYDIYNISSSFYYDVCLSAYINNTDLTLSLRQNEIYPKNISLCMDGCEYNGVNLETKRVNCLCNSNSESDNNKENLFEEVQQNFFIYIVDMINYQIIGCYEKLFNIKNYYYNIGFYIGFFLQIMFFILMIIYCFYGKKKIRIEYYHNRPNMIKIKENEIDFNKNFLMKENNPIFVLNKKKKFRKKKKKLRKISPDNNWQTNSNPEKRPKNKRTYKKFKRKKKSQEDVLRFSKENLKLMQSNIFENSNNSNNNQNNLFILNPKNILKTTIQRNEKNLEKIDYNELSYKEAIEKDGRNFFEIFISFFKLKFQTIQIIFYQKEYSHLSLTLSLYLLDILLDLTINSLLFSNDVISQKYFNNGELLFFTTNMLSISSNVISYFILYLTEKLINQYEVLDVINKEFKNEDNYYKIFLKLLNCFRLKITIFYLVLFFFGLFCTYYLFVFCAVYKKIQVDLFTNYIVGSLWSLGLTVFICLFITITRKLAINKRIKRLFVVSKFVGDKF